jgi:hypothetical protein
MVFIDFVGAFDNVNINMLLDKLDALEARIHAKTSEEEPEQLAETIEERLEPQSTSRRNHAAVYHTPHLYILGGLNGRCLSECERYVCAENRWEALPPLPRACYGASGVVVERSLYTLGGHYREELDWVQKLSLESLTWELMPFRLPFAGFGIPCFKLRYTEVYLVVNKTLCSFSAFKVRPLKTLAKDIKELVWSELLPQRHTLLL